MTSSKENLMPKFASTFQPLIDQEGYLVNQSDLSCHEVVGKSLAILRTSKDHEKSQKDAQGSIAPLRVYMSRVPVNSF